jgi:hypothetical protein
MGGRMMSGNHSTNRKQKRIDELCTSDHVERWHMSTEQVDGVFAYRTKVAHGDMSSITVTTEKLRQFAKTIVSHADYLDLNRLSEQQEDE